MLNRIEEFRDGAVGNAYLLYARNFGATRSLTDVEFQLHFKSAVDSICAVRNEDDINIFLERCRVFGEKLAVRDVPLGEFIITLQFFEDACLAAPGLDQSLRAHRAFDRLSHQFIASVASGYYSLRTGENAAIRSALERDVSQLAPETRTVFQGLVGASPPMRQLYTRLSAAASRRSTILLVGETGTGKELCARAIHNLSGQKDGPFIAVNCAAIPREIFASELFGHRRGSFTGAVTESKGLIGAAEHGTLFLDEVTEMDEAAQVALLRVIELRAIRPVGATKEQPVDIRVVSATNRDPDVALREKKLRPDLYHRLTATVIDVPPLRERIEDLPLLINYFLTRISKSENMPIPHLGHSVEATLAHHNWPGNVRELANCLESAVTFCKTSTIEVDDLPKRIPRLVANSTDRRAETVSTEHPQLGVTTEASPNIDTHSIDTQGDADMGTIRQKECELIRNALKECGGNKSAAARAVGISRKRLYARMREMGLADASGDCDDGTE